MAEIWELLEIGPDGWPMHPNHPTNRAPNRTLEQLHESYLRSLGRAPGVTAACPHLSMR